MEERSPGGFSPTKWAQFANNPARLAREGRKNRGGGRERERETAPAPARAPPAAPALLRRRPEPP